jgi:hypothetical protein
MEAELEALRNKLAGIRIAIDVLEDNGQDNDDAGEGGRTRRGAVKEALYALLKEAGKTGLNALTAVEMARKRGMELDRNTVSSTLSRMKKDGALDHDGERYRLKGLDQQVTH